jgi:hypothetical protein
MQRTVVYECISLRSEYSGGMKIQATNYLDEYLQAGRPPRVSEHGR